MGRYHLLSCCSSILLILISFLKELTQLFLVWLTNPEKHHQDREHLNDLFEAIRIFCCIFREDLTFSSFCSDFELAYLSLSMYGLNYLCFLFLIHFLLNFSYELTFGSLISLSEDGEVVLVLELIFHSF